MIKIGNIELPDFPFTCSYGGRERSAFRRLCKMHGADMMYSEFISSEGLVIWSKAEWN
jgi:tRNA-dihydrouridine synthase